MPLVMSQRNVDVVLMGFLFASMPLFMQFGRIFFAMLSDLLGRKIFFMLNGILGTVSGLIYHAAYTPLGFLFGKVAEGTGNGALWAVNRAFLLERNGGEWRGLAYLSAVTRAAWAVGSLLAGYLMALLLYEGTMLFCTLLGALVFSLSMLLVDGGSGNFSLSRALRLLDFRNKGKIFKFYLLVFLVTGLSFGFRSDFVTPLFLYGNGFSIEAVGLIVGMQTLLAGLSMFIFSKSSQVERVILFSGLLYTLTFSMLGFSSSLFAGILVIVAGFLDGMSSLGQEVVFSKICSRESYGTDISLLMTAYHLGHSLGLILAGALISIWGFAAPFLLSAFCYIFFYTNLYILLKRDSGKLM